MFWAEQIALNAIERVEKEFNEGKNKEKIITIRCGQTPSGSKHIGNLNDVIRAYFVYKILKDKIDEGKFDGNLRFVHTSDDRDPLKDIPKKIMDLDGKWHKTEDVVKNFEKYLGMPLCRIPDPFGCCKSWSEHFTKVWINGLEMLGIKPEIYYNDDLYKEGKFLPYIKKVFENREKVSEIVKRFQETKGENYIPFDAICPNCGRLVNIYDFDLQNNKVKFECKGKEIKKRKTEGCGYKGEIDIDEGKLQWRFEWPAQWGIFNTTFEPFGKDHYEGSWKSGQVIAKEIFNIDPPIPFVYEFFLVNGEKMSASKGNVYLVQDILKILEKEVFIYFYTKKPEKQRDLNLKEIFRLVDEFDRIEKIYYENNLKDKKLDELEKDKELRDIKITYELSSNVYNKLPRKVSYSSLSTYFSIFFPVINDKEKTINKVVEIVGKNFDEFDKKILIERIRKAGEWAINYIPEEEKIKIIDEENSREIYKNSDEKVKELLKEFIKVIEKAENDEKNKKAMDFIGKIKEDENLLKEFYKSIYMVLFGKEKGPKLTTILEIFDIEFLKKRFENES
ncbi:MAG: lysine--tRNA ligase [Candidatus Altarchaeaceae archaeon]